MRDSAVSSFLYRARPSPGHLPRTAQAPRRRPETGSACQVTAHAVPDGQASARWSRQAASPIRTAAYEHIMAKPVHGDSGLVILKSPLKSPAGGVRRLPTAPVSSVHCSRRRSITASLGGPVVRTRRTRRAVEQVLELGARAGIDVSLSDRGVAGEHDRPAFALQLGGLGERYPPTITSTQLP